MAPHRKRLTKWTSGNLARRERGLARDHLKLIRFNSHPQRPTTRIHVWGLLTSTKLTRILKKHPGVRRMKGHTMKGESIPSGAGSAVLSLPELYTLADRLLMEMDSIDEWLGSGGNGNRIPKRDFKRERAAKIARKGVLVQQYRTLKRTIAQKHRESFTIGK